MRSLQNTSYFHFIDSFLQHGRTKKQKLNLLERILYSTTLLFLPTQLGKHFWPDFALILGQRIDYLSPTLYVTDILIICLVSVYVFNKMSLLVKHDDSINLRIDTIASFSAIIKLAFIVFLSLLFFIPNIILSQVPQEGLYGLLKLFEIVFLTYYTGNILRTYPEILLFPLTFGIFSESVLAISQFFTQGSIGGILYYLGERTFTSVTPGIANASINGQLILRPYGTFPHPNVLAGYLVISMTIIHMILSNYKLRITKFITSFTLSVGTIGLLFTLSRVAILIWFFVCLFLFVRYLQKRNITRKFLLIANGLLASLVIILFIVSPLLPRFSSLTLQDESVVLREQLAVDSFKMLFARPFFGVGLNSFLPALPHYDFGRGSVFSIQPVHNIFLLIGAQTGFPGLWLSVSFVIWLYLKLFRKYRHPQSISGFTYLNKKMLKQVQHDDLLSMLLLTEVVILGSFDHYFLTIQQGQLLLGVIIGMCLSTIKENRGSS